MYSTHRFNPKALGANEGYLTINDAYDKPRHTDGRTKGKQFVTNPSKTGQIEGYFGKFEYVVDSYQGKRRGRRRGKKGRERRTFTATVAMARLLLLCMQTESARLTLILFFFILSTFFPSQTTTVIVSLNLALIASSVSVVTTLIVATNLH